MIGKKNVILENVSVKQTTISSSKNIEIETTESSMSGKKLANPMGINNPKRASYVGANSMMQFMKNSALSGIS